MMQEERRDLLFILISKSSGRFFSLNLRELNKINLKLKLPIENYTTAGPLHNFWRNTSIDKRTAPLHPEGAN